MPAIFTIPQCIISAADLSLKQTTTTTQVSNTAGFFTGLELTHTDQNYDSQTVQAVADTSRQTIYEVLTGSGILTQIMASALSGVGIMTLYVTIDGVELDPFFSGTTAAVDPRLCVGDFRLFGGTGSAATTNVGGRVDRGYGLGLRALMVNPLQTINDRNVGFVYENSFKVEQEGDVPLETGASGKAAVSYLTYIPHGVL